jgi:hypothetical protein
VAEPDVRSSLVQILRLLLSVQERVIELDLRTRALQIVLAQATGVDLKSAEDHLQKIVESLRSAEVDAAACATSRAFREGALQAVPDYVESCQPCPQGRVQTNTLQSCRASVLFFITNFKYAHHRHPSASLQ